MTKNTFNFTDIENKIGYNFNNKNLLKQAFTRSSYSAEHHEVESNEVLEFLGDSVLSMLAAKRLSERYGSVQKITNYFISELQEDELSKLKIDIVKRSSLAKAIRKAGLYEYLIMGSSDCNLNVANEDSVQEDLFEAILGAIAIDTNWDMYTLETVIQHLLDIDSVIEDPKEDELNYEKELGSWFEQNGEIMIFEREQCYCGDLDFTYSVNLGINMLNFVAYGYGKTEHGARKMASKRAMEFIGNTTNRADKIKNAVGLPDVDKSINQLQELWQKKIIPEPKYILEEHGKSDSGNPMWACSCKIEGLYDSNGSYICDSKIKAKKQVAYDALSYLFGKNLSNIMLMQGKEED